MASRVEFAFKKGSKRARRVGNAARMNVNDTEVDDQHADMPIEDVSRRVKVDELLAKDENKSKDDDEIEIVIPLKKRTWSKRDEEDKDHRDRESDDMPMLVANRVPGIEKLNDDDEKFRYDVSMRPNACALDDYERVPVEHFGKAMLSGMGWKPGDPIGMTNKQVVEPIEYISRGKLLGLGATPRLPPPESSRRRGKTQQRELMRPKPSADGRTRHVKSIHEELVPIETFKIRPNVLVEVTGGRHAGLYGRILDVSDGESRCTVRLLLNNDTLDISKSRVTVLDELALPDNHPARLRCRGVSQRRNDDASRPTESPSQPKLLSWIIPGIRVRVVSRRFADGAHYCKDGRIDDVVSPTQFTLVMDSGIILEHAQERHVQTVIPSLGKTVKFVQGKFKGAYGKILEKEKKRERAIVQRLDVVGDQAIIICSFDDISEAVSTG